MPETSASGAAQQPSVGELLSMWEAMPIMSSDGSSPSLSFEFDLAACPDKRFGLPMMRIVRCKPADGLLGELQILQG